MAFVCRVYLQEKKQTRFFLSGDNHKFIDLSLWNLDIYSKLFFRLTKIKQILVLKN